MYLRDLKLMCNGFTLHSLSVKSVDCIMYIKFTRLKIYIIGVVVSDKKSISHLSYGFDYELGLKRKRKNNHLFRAIGRAGEFMDAFRLTLELDNNERFLLGIIVDNLQYETNCSQLLLFNQTGNERNKISLGYKKLHKRGIVVRYKRNSYMVNPNFIIPPTDTNYDNCVMKWKEYNL